MARPPRPNGELALELADAARARLIAAAVMFAVVLGACGEDDGEGGGPDLFLGLSGLVIAVVVVWLVVRALGKRRR